MRLLNYVILFCGVMTTCVEAKSLWEYTNKLELGTHVVGQEVPVETRVKWLGASVPRILDINKNTQIQIEGNTYIIRWNQVITERGTDVLALRVPGESIEINIEWGVPKYGRYEINVAPYYEVEVDCEVILKNNVDKTSPFSVDYDRSLMHYAYIEASEKRNEVKLKFKVKSTGQIRELGTNLVINEMGSTRGIQIPITIQEFKPITIKQVRPGTRDKSGIYTGLIILKPWSERQTFEGFKLRQGSKQLKIKRQVIKEEGLEVEIQIEDTSLPLRVVWNEHELGSAVLTILK